MTGIFEEGMGDLVQIGPYQIRTWPRPPEEQTNDKEEESDVSEEEEDNSEHVRFDRNNMTIKTDSIQEVERSSEELQGEVHRLSI